MLGSKLSQLRSNAFVRNVVVVASGTAGAQIIGMAFKPAITRLYGPEPFGIVGAIVAVVSIIAPLSALAFPIATVLPKEDDDARALVRLSVLISTGSACIAAGMFVLFGEQLANFLNLESVSGYLWLIPLLFLLSGWQQAVQQWLIRKKHYRGIAKVSVAQAVLLNSLKFVGGLLAPFASVLVSINALGSAIHVLLLGWSARRTWFDTDASPLRNGQALPFRELFRRYYDFPCFRAPQTFLNSASQGLPVLMLASLFGPAAVGFYALGRSVMGIPASLIGRSIGDVFYPRIAEAGQRGENLGYLVVKATLVLAAVGFIPFAIVIAFGPWLFKVVFGGEWYRAGEYAQWIALWTYFMFVNTPSISVLPVIKAQSLHLVFTVFTISIRLGVLWIGYIVYRSDLVAVALFGASGAMLNVLLILFSIKLCFQHDRSTKC